LIPKTIHQTGKTRSLSKDLRKYQISWIKHNPEYKYQFYDDDDCEQFVRNHFPSLLQTYKNFPVPVQRADFFRYLVVYECGGIYADLDVECYRSIDSLIQSESAIFSIETKITQKRQNELGYNCPHQITNAIFAAEPKNEFLHQVIKRALKYSTLQVENPTDVEDSTGPRMLTRLYYELLKKKSPRIKILSQIYLMSPTLYPHIFPFNKHMFCRHHFMGSWKWNTGAKSLKRVWIERSLFPSFWPKSRYIIF